MRSRLQEYARDFHERRRVIQRRARVLEKPARDYPNCKPNPKGGRADVMDRGATFSSRVATFASRAAP